MLYPLVSFVGTLFTECAPVSVLTTGGLGAALESLAAKSMIENYSSINLYNIIAYFPGSSYKHLYCWTRGP